ncbi:hypothetical protein [Nostoc sp. PCC 9305]|uniref:hypothetical protein n=1 Tax=Nostoc sp. PCC 9305 TaxID=296636 RepID=UPI0039C61D49
MQSAFVEAGKALTQLRDRKLYRSTHKTFEEYCRVRPWRWRSHRFGFTRMAAALKIASVKVMENLSTNGYIHLNKYIKQQQQRSLNKGFYNVV